MISSTEQTAPTGNLLSPAERRIVVEQWNRTASPYPESACLHELFEIQARKTPASAAVVQGNKSLTYSELDLQSQRLASHLQSLGVGQGTPVAVCLPSSIDFAIALLGILKAGGSCVPLDPTYPQARLSFMLEDVNAPVLVTRRGLLQKSPAISTTLLFDELSGILENQSSASPAAAATAESVAYIIYTSGSTGTPKGVLLGHRGLVNHAVASIGIYGMTAADRTLQFSSLSFDIAIEEIFPTWTAGGTLVLKDSGFSLGFAEFTDSIRKLAITVLDLPTAYWHEWTNFLHDNPSITLPESLRLVIVGGEKVSAAILGRWQTRVGGKIRWVNTYGPSEASVIATVFEPTSDEPVSAVPIGRPIANVQVYLLDSSLEPVPVGAPGELYIGGAGIALGYLNRPELTAEKFGADPFAEQDRSAHGRAKLYRTGDMARYRPDGEIEFLGRQDNQIKIRGFRVEPGEIEEVLARHHSVREVAVVAREEATGEKRLIAYVVAGPEGQTAIEMEGLRKYLQDRLPDYMVPSAFVELDTMPMTPNGKVDRKNLPAPAPIANSASDSSTGGGSSLESSIVAIWQDLLGRRVGAHDNFFELGGHSLMAARMMNRVGHVVGRPLPLAMLLESATPQQLAEALANPDSSQHWSSVVAIQPEGNRPPFFCIHGVGGNVVGFRDLGRRMGPTHPFFGIQARGLDGSKPCIASVEEMAARYLSDIRSVQPEGPYFLGGYSFGGLVAYEMARTLEARGEEVALLGLFDTAPGNLQPATSSLLKKIARPSAKFLFSELPQSAYKGIRRRWRALLVPQHLKQVFMANTRAAHQYELKPYAGKITLFRALEKSLRTADDPYAAWNHLALGGVEFKDIPGDHFGVLVEPRVSVFAERLRASIDAALENGATTESGSHLERAVS